MLEFSPSLRSGEGDKGSEFMRIEKAGRLVMHYLSFTINQGVGRKSSCEIHGESVTFDPKLLSLKTNPKGDDKIYDWLW